MGEIELPTADQFADAEELATELADRLRPAPLGGSRRNVTKEVRDWAAGNGLDGDDPGTLEKYNDAATQVPEDLREQLKLLIADPHGRRAVISLLGMTGTSDPVRLLALDALHRRLGAGDVEAFARANIKQRPAAIAAAVKVLAEIRSAEALFALGKVFAQRDDDAGAVARRLEDRLWSDVPEAAAIRSAVDGRELDFQPGELDPGEVLFSAMALPSRGQARLAAVDAGPAFLERGQPAALKLDAALRGQVEDGSSLGAYPVRQRDELLELALLTVVPDDEDLQRRAAENLFRRDDLGEVKELAPHLPVDVLTGYASRALTKENRRRARPERAIAALEVAREREHDVREALRSLAIECLDEQANSELRCEAARLLAVDEEELPAEIRAQLSRTYDELPPRLQSRLARELRGVSGAPTQLSSFLRWVEAARGDEIRRRLSELLARWAGERKMSVDDASELLAVFAAKFAELSSDDQASLEGDLIDVTAGWLYDQRTRIVGPVEALTRWQRFRWIVADNLERFTTRLRADAARLLVAEALGARSGDVNPVLVTAVADLELDPDEDKRVREPVLQEAVERDPEAATQAITAAGDRGARNILWAGLRAAVATKADIERLDAALARGTTEALVAKQTAVREALDETEEAAQGNERLSHLFAEIGRAVNTEDATLVAPGAQATPESRSGDDAADAVIEWRLAVSAGHSGAVAAPNEGREPLVLAGTFRENADDLGSVVKDLDRRAYSKRIAPVVDREHYRGDLQALIDELVATGAVVAADDGVALDPAIQNGDALIEILAHGRPEMRELFWSRWRATGPGGETTSVVELPEALRALASDPLDQARLSRLEGALSTGLPDDAREAVAALAQAEVGNAWAGVRALLERDLRRASELSRRESGKEQAIGAEIASDLNLPFEEIEALLFSYFRLREQIGEAGWRPIEDRLGRVRTLAQLDPELHEVRRGGEGAKRFVVRSLGIKFKGTPVSRAIVEPLELDAGDGESSEEEEEEE